MSGVRKQTWIERNAGTRIASVMDRRAARYLARWTDGGNRWDLMDIYRAAGVPIVFALAFIVVAGLIVVGLTTGRIAVP